MRRARAHHDGDQFEIAALRRRGHAVSGRCRVTGLDAGGGVVIVLLSRLNEVIRIRESRGERAVRKVHVRGRGVLLHQRILHQFDRYHRQIVCRLFVDRVRSRVVRQSVRIDEGRFFQAEGFGALIHDVGEVLGRSGDLFGERFGGIVGRLNHQRCQQRLHGKCLSLHRVNLRAAHLARARGDHDGRVELETAIADLFHRDQRRHHLGHRRRRQRDVFVLGEDHALRRRLDHECGGVSLAGRVDRRAPGDSTSFFLLREERKSDEKREQYSVHDDSSEVMSRE